MGHVPRCEPTTDQFSDHARQARAGARGVLFEVLRGGYRGAFREAKPDDDGAGLFVGAAVASRPLALVGHGRSSMSELKKVNDREPDGCSLLV